MSIAETTGRRCRFVEDDRYGLWKAGDEATDLGWEGKDVPMRLLDYDGQILSLSDPFGRGLVEYVEPDA